MSYVPPQIRTIFYQEVTFASAGATTQTFSLSTTLSAYTKALLQNRSRQCMVFNATDGNETGYRGKLTSNTQIDITGATGGGDKTIGFTVVEYQNLPV